MFPDYPAPAPVPSVRNTSSAHWRGWMNKPANRSPVPFNSFAEFAPEPNPDTNKKDIVWFALDDERPLTSFAGIRTEFKGERGAKIEADPRPSPCLRLPHDNAERVRRGDPSEGDARHPDH
jgi:putative SOS response-associated peptidase YedK